MRWRKRMGRSRRLGLAGSLGWAAAHGVARPTEGLIVEVPPGLLESFLPAGGTLSVQH